MSFFKRRKRLLLIQQMPTTCGKRLLGLNRVKWSWKCNVFFMLFLFSCIQIIMHILQGEQRCNSKQKPFLFWNKLNIYLIKYSDWNYFVTSTHIWAWAPDSNSQCSVSQEQICFITRLSLMTSVLSVFE